MKDNRLILDFMGIKPHSVIPDIYYWNDAPFFYISEDTPEKVMDGIVEYSKYHTSWDWLKPVIDKIITTIGVATVDECTDEEWRLHTSISRMHIGIPIEWAYNYVIEWLKWYYKKNHE